MFHWNISRTNLETFINLEELLILVNTAKPGLRSANKAKRRAAILDATRQLLREGSIEDLKIAHIAERAEVVVATIYNLVGTRDKVLGAVMDETFDRVGSQFSELSKDRPLEYTDAVMQQVVHEYCNDPAVHRQLLMASSTLGSLNLREDPSLLPVAAMQRAQEKGLLGKNTQASVIGYQIYLAFQGTLLDWARGHLNDHEFKYYSHYALWVNVAAHSSPDCLKDHTQRLAETSNELSKSLASQKRQIRKPTR